ncbi:MAG TPA: tyrosine-type recombinase/integrase [Propionibacteriaceae bacterium]|nr:tyrosine-type recombinase/integrase [Propionibacteriaceae bacterium]
MKSGASLMLSAGATGGHGPAASFDFRWRGKVALHPGREQDQERAKAGQLWVETGRVFTDRFGRAVKPNSDYHAWKALLKRAGVRETRLHDARHTAATVLLAFEVPERTVMGVMGWSSTSMAARYQHITDPIRHEVASRVGGLLWSPPQTN